MVALNVTAIFTADADLVMRMKTGYAHDTVLAEIVKDIEARVPAPGWILEDGLLYRVVDEAPARLVVPNTPNLRQKVIREHHDSVIA